MRRNFTDICDKYAGLDYRKLNIDDLEKIKRAIGSVQPEELVSQQDHIQFINLLQKLRSAIADNDKLHGDGFNQWLESNLSVGEDGLYSDKLRFLFELVQNVDDCDYADIGNCRLDVEFKTIEGCIVFTYNELGFKPSDVFAITGIAEKSKNISPKKTEIGEKGIGFKSVFGVAHSVLIQSGGFSFKLLKNNFTVPVAQYNEYTPRDGTRLTLYMPGKQVQELYYEMVERYCKPDVLANKNPLLFLNKLSKIKFFIDHTLRYLEFNVSRTRPVLVGQNSDISYEKLVIISVRLADPKKNFGKEINKEIKCYRYSKPVIFDHRACVSRYSANTNFREKKLNLFAVFPHPEFIGEIKKKGSLYSFLPTQIRTNVPLMVHVPFKLDASREYVDPQNENKWFTDACYALNRFLTEVYCHLSHIVKEYIIGYLPPLDEFFFDTSYQKAKCLERLEFMGSILEDEKLFYCSNGNYAAARDICAFCHTENIEKPTEVFKLLDEDKFQYVSPIKTNLARYGIDVIEKVYEKVFLCALKNPKITEDAFDLLEEVCDFKNMDILPQIDKFVFTIEQLRCFDKHRKIYRLLRNSFTGKVIKGIRPNCTLADSVKKINIHEKFSSTINEIVSDIDSNSKIVQYLNLINKNYTYLSNVSEGFYLPLKTTLVLSERAPFKSFSEFAKHMDKNNKFSASLQMRQISEDLNRIDDTISNEEYLKELKIQRGSLKTAFGDQVYQNYIQLINQAGTDESRFLNELLQNADDCEYNPGEVPSLSLLIRENILTISYNEVGFTKANVRAITAIGESTKKLLLNGSATIGEKGVGFKSVFSVAESVEIHSNGFHFKLTDQMPTIPVNADENINAAGTTMIFKLKKSFSRNFINEPKILAICLCLRKLRRLSIGKLNVEIKESANTRSIIINDSIFELEKYCYNFSIKDESAIRERENGQRTISSEQSIHCYIPKDEKLFKHTLYCGLPTSVSINIPMIIDAPFQLTTARDDILENRWSNIIKANVYEALVDMIEKIKYEKRIDVFAYIKHPNDTFSSDYLNNFNMLPLLRNKKILPTLEKEHFVAPFSGEYNYYPAVVGRLFSLMGNIIINKRSIIDFFGKSEYAEAIKWLGCKPAPKEKVIDLLGKYASQYIDNARFRKQLYTYLKEESNPLILDAIKQMKIIPVKGKKQGVTEYIPFLESIYYGNEECSTDEYYIIRDGIMSPEDFDAIYQTRINIMNQFEREGIYRKKIESWLDDTSIPEKELAERILNEFQNNRAQMSACKDMLISRKTRVPVKFESGEYYKGNIFISDKPAGYFYGEILKKMVVDKKYEALARFMECPSINDLRYEDIDVDVDALTEDDIEDFQDDNISYGAEILEKYIKNGKVSEELIKKYTLEGVWLSGIDIDGDIDYTFPVRPIMNLDLIKKRIRKRWEQPVRIVKRKVSIPVSYGVMQSGQSFKLDKAEHRKYAIEMYRCDNNHEVCFCQMCRTPKIIDFIEINNIEHLPKYFWVEMKLSLCLECSKIYEALRNNKSYSTAFLERIRNAELTDEEPIKIQIGNKSVFFTATHLAEIKEILNK